MTYEKRWDEMRWEELRWGEKRRDEWDEMRWDEMKCGAWSVKCKREVWSVKTAVCSVEFQARPLEQCNSVTQSTHARAWLAHGACKFYKWKRFYISLRQLPPRLVRVLLVIITRGCFWTNCQIPTTCGVFIFDDVFSAGRSNLLQSRWSS